MSSILCIYAYSHIIITVPHGQEKRIIISITCGAPKPRTFSLISISFIAFSTTSRQSRKAKGILPLIIGPATIRLEHSCRHFLATNSSNQGFKFFLGWKMPSCRTNTLHNITEFALTSITAFVIRHVYRCSPQIKATVLSTVSRIIIIAETSFRLIIQVFRHPDLFTNDYGPIRLPVTSVNQHARVKSRPARRFTSAGNQDREQASYKQTCEKFHKSS